jgi:membrane protease subunit HflK
MAQFDPNNIKPPEISFKQVRIILITLLVLVGVFTSITVIDTEEEGVVLFLGKYDRTLPRGLNFIMPFRLETVEKVPVLRQLKQEFGFRTQSAGVRSQYSNRRFDDESLMLTGDLNAAAVEWIVQYTIQDPYKYLYKVKNVTQTFRYINLAVIREIVGDRTVDEVITFGRADIQSIAKERVQELCNQYEMGIKIDQFILQDVNPPDEVKPSFNKVNESEQQKDRLVQEAEAEYNKIIPKARGEALRIVEEAKGYATERINLSEGEAARFNALYNEYRKAREVTRTRIYIETMEQVLNKAGKKIITDDKSQGILPLFDYGKKGGN